eukprot:TRINITY_DN93627_c0_g1_i1.p1 TRINITY_DN93627_c0_g1~~TRINITY_DN93627_c0_g1_i1.p1  ORF type:complete len:356 (-),score=55.09 TRINITY_DN93627_c0_g1_i1:140-1207(-)
MPSSQAAEASTSLSLRGICCVTLFLLSYAILIPGLFDELFSFKADMMVFGFSSNIADISQSTVGTVRHLYNLHYHLAAFLVLLFSVIVPALKLIATIIAACRIYSDCEDKDAEHLVRGLQSISKWATVDAFCVMTFAAALGGISAGVVSIDLQIHRGFYCFLAYCVLSVAAALTLPSATTYFVPPPLCRRMGLSFAFRMAAVLVALGLFCLLLCVPVIEFEIGAIGVHRKLSMVSLLKNLLDGGFLAPAVAYFTLAMLLPGLYVLLATANELDLDVPLSWAISTLGHFAMADVLVLSILVTRLAGAGLSDRMSVEILPGGRYLLLLLAFRPFLPWAATVFVTHQRAKMAEYVEEV